MGAQASRLDPTLRSIESRDFEAGLRRKIVGQDEAVQAVVALRSQQLEQILEIELGMVQRRVLDTAKGRFIFRVTPAAREFLLKEGTDLKYGARHLTRAIEPYVVHSLASLLSTEQVAIGDVIAIDWNGADAALNFIKDAEGALISLPPPTTQVVSDAAVAVSGGRSVALAQTLAASEQWPFRPSH